MVEHKKQTAPSNTKHIMAITQDILTADHTPSTKITGALHERISNLQPHEALLCAAKIMKEIAKSESIISTDLTFLQMESANIIKRYTAENEPDIKDIENIAEDLQGLIELTTLCHMSYEITNPKIAKLLNIITIQLQSHLMIIDEAIAMHQTHTPTPDNIIMFPNP